MKTIHKNLELKRNEQLVEFDCNICHKHKKSKLIAKFVDQPSSRICNGCYGQLLVEDKI